MSATPAVSIVTAAYNGARMLPETIDSVLAQTFADWEMIVVDDRSTDDTLAMLARYDDPRIRVVAQPQNGGPVVARNAGAALARGRYLAGLDQDDLCHPERLGRQAAFLDAHRDVVLLGTAIDYLENGRTTPGHLPGTTSPGLLRWLLMLRNPLAWSSTMMRMDAVRRLDPFERADRLFAEDFDLYHRLAAFGAIARLDEPLLLYRVHAGGASNVHQERMIASTAAVLSDAYAAALGGYAGEGGVIVSRHLGAGRPAPDVATLHALAAVIDRLWEDADAQDAAIGQARDLVEAETSRMWWRLIQRTLRAGQVTAEDALDARPHLIAAAEHDPGGFLASRVIASGRSLRSRARR